ncbi:MAG TPA: MFS transporter [Thermoanaerobaculia bacterium]|nr:MFS transporter [Thermoanaerobaculia bacterium]
MTSIPEIHTGRREPAVARLDPGVVTLGWVSFLSDVASDMIYPLLPDFLTRTLGAGPAAIGLIEGIAESTASFAKVVSGRWSDRIRHRKRFVVLGYLLAAVVRPLVGVAQSWGQVLAIRFTDRVGKGVRTPPRDALLADLTPPESRGRAFGLQRAMDNAGAFVGPLLAALLLKFVIPEERTVFLLAVVPGLAAVALLLWRVPERPRQAPADPDAAAPAERLPSGLWIAIGIFVVFALANSTDAFLLLRARQQGVPLWQMPVLWAFFQGVKAAAGTPGGALSDRIGRAPTLMLGWTVYGFSYVGFAFATSTLAIWPLFAFYGLFFALTEGTERAMVADLVPERLRGRAFGAFHAAIGLAALPASLFFGILWKAIGPRPAFLVGAGLALLATAALFLLRERIRPLEPR